MGDVFIFIAGVWLIIWFASTAWAWIKGVSFL